MKRPGILGLVIVSCMLFVRCGEAQKETVTVDNRPPNIVVLFADDLGYGDLGNYGHPTIRTTNLDRMATEGQKWTNFYVASAVCSPSRAALLTGRLPMRSGMYGTTGRTRVLFPDSPQGFPDDEVTLAEALRDLDYVTGIYGKWHLGHLAESLPTAHGFDQWLGLPYSNDMDLVEHRDEPWPGSIFFDPKSEYWNVPLFRDDAIIERPVDQTVLTKRYTEEAVAFIETNREQSFFLYLPYTMPHVPLFASEAFNNVSRAGLYGDVIEEIDWSVGQILDALRNYGLEENTLVIFTSDNGPWLALDQHGGSAGLLRQGKGTTWEGGVRVPAIFWWPGTITPATVQAIGSSLDVFPTALALAGGTLPIDRAFDGLDLQPVLKATGDSPRKVLYHYRSGELYAVRKGPFKLHVITEGSYGQGGERVIHNPPLLFHLGEDPGEHFNVANQYPEVVADILTEIETHQAAFNTQASVFDLRPPAN